jgi:aryl-alcohol dehydrogenase-like predicted oxidoreductase
MELYKKIGIGTVQFGLNYGISNTLGQTNSEEVANILSYCKTNGITILDTAYGYGDSEKVLGQNVLKEFKIISKFLSPKDTISIAEQFKISTERLKTKKLYGYLAHRPMDVYENPSQWEEIKNMKSNGFVEKIGFSFNTPEEIDLVLEAAMIPDLVQVPFNFFDNRFEEKLIFLKENYNCEIHTRSVFLQGLFFTNPDKLPDFFNPIKALLEDFKETHANLTGSLLKFALSKPFIDCVIIGVNNIKQLKENMNSLEESVIPKRNIEQIIPNEILIPSHWPQS